jgi:hypothetical protein
LLHWSSSTTLLRLTGQRETFPYNTTTS